MDFEDSGGVYLEFMRVPKVVEEDPKKKPVKGKAQEEVKPCGGKAWIDLSGLQTPGREELYLRAKLEESEGDIFFKDTYIYLRLKVTPCITPIMTPVIFPSTQTESKSA